MNIHLRSRKTSLLLRVSCLILLLGFTPFLATFLYQEGKYYGILFLVAILIIIVPELYIKLFFKPVAAVLEENTITLKYYHGTIKHISLDQIGGYSTTEEQTNYGKKNGCLLYIKNGKHLDFSEINITDISPLRSYLDVKNIPYYGAEKLRPWYSQKYKYDRPDSNK